MVSQVVVLCISAYLIQSIAGQCARPIFTAPCVPIALPENGGLLIATSVGPIRPSGVAVNTDLSLAGNLALNGALPFLSAVSFEGQFPNSGTAAVSYSCGDGNVAITQEQGNLGGNAASPAGLSLGNVGLGSCGRRCY